jgi:hypothetical protein
MANALEQTKNLFSVDDYNKDDISDKSKIIKALDNPAFGEFRSKEEIIDKAKKTGTGLLTGTLAIPSDILSGAEMVNTALADYANSPTAMVLKNAFKEASDKYGRPAFDKWFNKTTGLESNPENVDQLIGEVLSPTGTLLSGAKLLKPVGKVGKQIVKDTKAFFDDMSGGDGGALATANNAPIQSIDETSKLLDKTKVTKPIDTSAPIIPESEFVNAKPTINKLFAGEGTETGKKQAAKFRELEAQNKYTAEELFLKTRVYRGDDGQLRWEISTADAKLKNSWEKSLNFKKDNFNFEDEFLGITVPEKADGFYDSRASMQLSQILDFPTAYKEYYNVKGVTKYFDDVQTKNREVMSETQLSPLRNLQVYWERGDKYSNTLGYYTPAQDKITLNVRQLKAAARQTAEDYGIPFEEAFKLQVQSTLLHEVQHAVQLREGFRMGGDSDNFLPKDYDIFVSTNKQKKDRIFLDIEDQFDVAIAEIAKKDSSYNALAVRNKILNEVETDFNTLYDVLVHKKTNSIDKYKNKSIEELNAISKEAKERLNNKFSTFKDYIYSEDIDRMKLGLSKNAEENIKLINIDTAATNKYYNLYGEREARLVQKRLEDRFKLNKLGGAEVAKEVESDTKFLSPKGDTDVRGRKLGQMGGFPADTKITPTKLMADGTTFNNTIKKLKSANVKPDNPVFKKIAKYPDVKIGKDGLPVNILKNESGKPLILYYGDTGLIAEKGSDKRKYFQMTPKKSSDPPIKIQDKFRGAERLKDDLTGFGNKATFVSSNPNMASSYAFKGNPDDYEGSSLIPIYVLAKEVKDYPRAGIIEFDKLASKAPPGTVISLRNSPDSIGYDLAKEEIYPRAIHKATGQDQYAFTNGTQVFSALTGERLSATFTSKNVRNRLRNLQTKEEYGDFLRKEYNPHRKKLQELYKDNPKMLEYINSKEYLKDGDEMSFMNTYYKERLETIKNKDDLPNQKKGTVLSKDTMYQGGLQLAKGGVTMYNQMEMFQDGGLKDEGGTIDPVSGNDVPSGSTQEEVRDDIPAQLSEGEFVFPADVVRFIGLEKLMMMRQEAKAGLKRMEEMGQMGNSDEATIPDDVPFTMDDIDMEDDDTVEMAQGGVIQAANGTFVNTAPNVMYNPSQFATGQNLPSQQNNPNAQPVSYNAPVYNPVPAGSYTPTYYNQLNKGNENIATFENLVGNNYGQYDELRKYTSESGLVLNIPFKGGQPIYPIPEGYTYVDPEATKTEEVKTVTPTPQTTQVTQQDDGGDDPDGGGGAVDLVGDKFSYKSMFNMDTLDKAMKDIAGNQISLFNLKDAGIRGFKGSLDVGNATLSVQKDVLETFKIGSLNASNRRTGGKNAVYGDNFNLADMNQTDRDFLGNMLNNISDRVKNLMTDPEGKAIDINGLVDLVKSRGLATKVTKENFYAKGTNIISKTKVNSAISQIIASDIGLKKTRRDDIQKGEYISDQTEADKGYDFGAGISGAQIEDTSDRKGSQQSYEQESSYDDSSYSDYGDGSVADAYDDPMMNKGGLLGKRKVKPKKMKRGGLASRK